MAQLAHYDSAATVTLTWKRRERNLYKSLRKLFIALDFFLKLIPSSISDYLPSLGLKFSHLDKSNAIIILPVNDLV